MTNSSFNVPPFVLAMRNDEIHIWRAVLDQPHHTIQRLAKTLSADEKRRAKRFHFAHDRRRFIAGRGILRTLLGNYLCITPDRIRFNYGPNGKPFIADLFNKENLRFNLCHSKGYALLAFTHEREIGVDIESIDVFSEMEKVAEHYFSNNEHRTLKNLSNGEKNTTFYNYWTRKEAFAKAVGMGLSDDLDQIDVRRCPGPPNLVMNNETNSNKESSWFIQDLNPVPGFAAAFAVEGRNWRLHCWQWSENFAKFSLNNQPLKRLSLN